MYTRLSYLSTGVFVFRGIMQTQTYKGIVIDENCFKDDGAPLTMAMLVQVNLKEGRFGRSPAIEAVFPKFKPYHYSRIYNDEVTRPDAEFCLHRAFRWAQESWPTACAWTRLRWKIEGWRITQVTTI